MHFLFNDTFHFLYFGLNGINEHRVVEIGHYLGLFLCLGDIIDLFCNRGFHGTCSRIPIGLVFPIFVIQGDASFGNCCYFKFGVRGKQNDRRLKELLSKMKYMTLEGNGGNMEIILDN
jgi:hypothetical protein